MCFAKSHTNTHRMQRIFFWLLLLIILGCSKAEQPSLKPIIIMKTGSYTVNGSKVPPGGRLSFGITASGGGATLTNLLIRRKLGDQVITELDKGIYINEGGLNIDFTAVKGMAEEEDWTFMVMNANRDTAVAQVQVLLGEGSAWGSLLHFESVVLGMQHNGSLPNFLDLHNGMSYTQEQVQGHEAEIDLVAFVYTTGGIISPTLCCPAYSGSSSVTGHYPAIAGWVVRNSTLYDYYTSDNQLISAETFDAAVNDSLLVTAFNPGNVSGLCKYAFAGRVIPFRTEEGKYGLIKVKHADELSDGAIELEIKIQQ